MTRRLGWLGDAIGLTAHGSGQNLCTHDLKDSNSQITSGILLAIGLILVTWLFFGPIAGFHHMYGFGITFYLMLNGEDPRPGDYMWGQYAVHFFPRRFIVSLLLWLLSIFGVCKFVRALTKPREVTEIGGGV